MSSVPTVAPLSFLEPLIFTSPLILIAMIETRNKFKGRATLLSKTLLTAGLLGGTTLGIIALSEAPAEALTTSLGKFAIEIEDGTPGTRGPYYGGTFFVDLLTDDDPVGNPALISKFGNSSYWLSHEPGSTKNFNVVLLPTGTLFGEFGPALPDGSTNNLIAKTINAPYVDGRGFAFAYLDNPLGIPASDDSYQIFSKPSSAPEGFSYYGCWGERECVNAKMTAQTPGPLPLLGVGAAFGFSRNLRKRIKATKTPEAMSALG